MKLIILHWFILYVCLFFKISHGQEFEEPCNSTIYCQGPLLETVQLNHLFVDDKTFVDLAMKHPPQEVLSNFEALGFSGDVHGNETLIDQIRDFVALNFEDGTEFVPWTPSDWIDNPVFLNNISDPDLKSWAETLHSFWEELGRQIKEDVSTSDRYSMHYVSHPVIVPGGRFKEFYYWDSYWIQKGLIVSEMTATVRGMIENFVEMVGKLGYIPNGGRIYYERSQPPLFIGMVKNYFDATGNLTFIRDNIRIMEEEFQFFMEHRTVTFQLPGGQQSYKMARYNVDRKGPRPESYSKDFELVEPLTINETEKDILYANLKAGAESGWDFSSRWFVTEDNEIEANLSHTKTRDIIPVDLNGFLYWNAIILEEFCQLVPDNCTLGNATYYARQAADWKQAIHDVLWDEELGSWFDYDYVRGNLRKEFFATNVVPLWVKAHHNETAVPKIVKYFNDAKATTFPGGIPSSMAQTGQQWDFPNGWAPLNHMVVEAFEYSGNQAAQELAFDLAQRWTRTNHLAYLTHNNTMFEKYDVTCLGCAGGGGEYEVVVGFGWTNGVILDFLQMYGNRMTAYRKPGDSGSSSVHVGIVTLIFSLLSVLKSCNDL
ncbi:trehalase [Folsomia candida]|uniref:Trehalase n=1 Tax=Folsomia candida TaxID=158441 RepID=A0A226ESS9_FOLCA|nr:trehalase [Folsomia candida]OXA60695.1 Trehalase [Folsomia candida]